MSWIPAPDQVEDRLFAGMTCCWLAALALLVAESDPKHKDVLIRLIMNMLAGVTV